MTQPTCCCIKPCACQTFEELEFERGIWFAAQHNDLPRVKHLINKIKDVNVEDKFGYSALHYASRNGNFEMCKFLISQGANVNALTRFGKASSLHRCASMGHLKIFKLLIDSGALIDIKDSDGKTILHRAVEGGHTELVKEILKLSPNLVTEIDNKGQTPKDYKNASCENLFNIK